MYKYFPDAFLFFLIFQISIFFVDIYEHMIN
jgi:hypothetical protein